MEYLWKELEAEFGITLNSKEKDQLLQMAIRKFIEIDVNQPRLLGVSYGENSHEYRKRLIAHFIPCIIKNRST